MNEIQNHQKDPGIGDSTPPSLFSLLLLKVPGCIVPVSVASGGLSVGFWFLRVFCSIWCTPCLQFSSLNLDVQKLLWVIFLKPVVFLFSWSSKGLEQAFWRQKYFQVLYFLTFMRSVFGNRRLEYVDDNQKSSPFSAFPLNTGMQTGEIFLDGNSWSSDAKWYWYSPVRGWPKYGHGESPLIQNGKKIGRI